MSPKNTAGETVLQRFLRGNGTLEELKEKYSISATQHKKYPNLYLFKYDQIESPFSEQIVRESRSIILDKSKDWAIVARAFDKFFNFGEQLAAQIDWKTARVQEKLDGSLIVMYFYDGTWQVATSGSPDASGRVGDSTTTFEELFWRTWENMGLDLPSPAMKGITMMFELMTPYNKVVIPHKESTIKLIGARLISTGEEMPIEMLTHYPIVKHFDITDEKGVLEALSKMNGAEQEGFVVVDANYNRIKMKCDDYVKLHKLKDSFSFKNLLDLIRANEQDELILHFPEYTQIEAKIRTRLVELQKHLEDTYTTIKDKVSQKDFALEAVKSRMSAALFALRKGQVNSIKHYLQEARIDGLADVLKLDELKELPDEGRSAVSKVPQSDSK